MDSEKALAIVTGGTSGLGHSIAKKLSLDYNLALIFKSNSERAQAALSEFREKFPASMVRIYQKDIFDFKSAASIYEEIKVDFSQIPRVLVNAAGYTERELFLKSSNELFQRTFDDHFFGLVGLTHAVIEDMYMQKYGRIVSMSSIASLGNQRGLSAYASAKAAVEAFSKSIATEVFHKNVTVNTISPGPVDNSVGGISETEISDLVYYLISDSAKNITAENFLIDQGDRKSVV